MTHTRVAARHQNIIKEDTVLSVISAVAYSHCSQVYKKHATEKTRTNSREEKRSKERGERGREEQEEINTETVDHEKQDARKQVGRGMKASHRVQSIIPVVLMLKLNII